jgi:hypothetical protein
MGTGDFTDDVGIGSTGALINASMSYSFEGSQFFTATLPGSSVTYVLVSWVTQSASYNNGNFSASAVLHNP